MFIFQKVEEAALKSNDSRQYIADFLLREKTKVRNYSMQQIADATFSSKTTLVRFAKKLGFSGWMEFLDKFLEEAHYLESHFSEVDPNFPFSREDSLSEIVRKVSLLQIESIRDTVELISEEEIKTAGDRILNAKRIVLFGMSPNSLLCHLFRRKMETIGVLMNVAAIDEGGLIAATLDEDDCAIVVSYSGNNPNREPMRFIKTLKERNVPMIGISGLGDNYLRENIPCCLNISSRERLYSKITTFATEESIQFLFNVLFSYCFSQNYVENYNQKLRNSIQLEYRRSASSIEMRDDPSFLE